MPTIGAHLPKDWPHHAALAAHLEQRYRGKVSPYLLDLIETDLTARSGGQPDRAHLRAILLSRAAAPSPRAA